MKGNRKMADTKNTAVKVTLTGKTYLQIKAMGFSKIAEVSDQEIRNPKQIADMAKTMLPVAVKAHQTAAAIKRTRDTATIESASRGVVNELLRLIKGYDKMALAGSSKDEDDFQLSRSK